MTDVTLIKKIKGPKFMHGKFNGMGGKINSNESPGAAMARECEEECGVVIPVNDWFNFHHIRRFDENEVFFYAAIIPDGQTPVQKEEEEIYTVKVSDVLRCFDTRDQTHCPYVYNLYYLIPMGMIYINHPEHMYLEG